MEDLLTQARVWLTPSHDEPPSEDVCRRLLPAESLSRAAAFGSARRAREFLWSRLALLALLARLGLPPHLRERPPGPPLIDASSLVHVSLSISHSRRLYAVAAALCPLAIDVETLRPGRSPRRLAARLFGPTMADLPDDRLTEAFYAAWGARECAVKLPGAMGGDCLAPTLTDLAGRPTRRGFWRLGPDSFLTVVTVGDMAAGWRMISAAELDEALAALTAGSGASPPVRG